MRFMALAGTAIFVAVALSSRAVPKAVAMPTAGHGRALAAGVPARIASPERPAQSDWDDALAAALTYYNAVPISMGESCSDNNPGHQTCIVADPTPQAQETARRGIFTFGIGDPDGGGAFAAWGRAGDGTWQPWFATQNVNYWPVALPGGARVCADGDGLNVHDTSAADASVVTVVPDGTVLTAEEFVLTQAQPRDAQGQPTGRGDGWYRISGPAAGWVNDHYISSTQLPDCSVRDAFEHR